jgi:hypothetical protein
MHSGAGAAARPPAPGRAGFDLVYLLRDFLHDPAPIYLVITGVAGAGKSSLLRALMTAMPSPKLFVAYRSRGGGSEDAGARGSGLHELSLLLIESGPATAAGPAPAAESPATMMSFAPASSEAEPDLPRAFTEAIVRVAVPPGGSVVVDTWDAASERQFRSEAGDGARAEVVNCPMERLRAQFGRAPIRGVFVLTSPPTRELLSTSDGVVHLEWEEMEGFHLRVISIPKLRRAPPPESRYLYTLHGGEFYCPPQLPPGFQPPIGPPDPDPGPDDSTIFPGNLDFAEAFGRLRFRGMTAFEVEPRFPSAVGDVFLYPLVSHALSMGGRVVWVPSATTTPSEIIGQLARFVPPDFLRERLRVLSAGGSDAALGELRSVAMPVRRESGQGGEIRAAIAPAVGPLFPDAFRFLQSAPDGKPALFVMYLDGIVALAAVAEIPVHIETYPLVVSSYMRIPRFHGLGFGRSDDPLLRGLLGEVDAHVRIAEKYGRTVLLGTRPRTSPYILDWTDASGRYSLVPVR